MEDRTKTIAAVSIIIGLALLILIVVGVILTSKKVLSPVPDEGAIKIIFITPTPVSSTNALISPSTSPTVTPTPKSR